MRNVNWPDGSLKVISREAMASIERGRGFDQMTPEQRLETAKGYDRLKAMLHASPCTCEGKKPTCIYCGGSGTRYSNMTPGQRAEHEAQAHASFLSRQWQGD